MDQNRLLLAMLTTDVYPDFPGDLSSTADGLLASCNVTSRVSNLDLFNSGDWLDKTRIFPSEFVISKVLWATPLRCA
jgi:hypothetical protein